MIFGFFQWKFLKLSKSLVFSQILLFSEFRFLQKFFARAAIFLPFARYKSRCSCGIL